MESLWTGTTIHFRLFVTEYALTERQLANVLGFSSCCSLAEEPARWTSLIIFPRADARCTTVEDLKCLYAMVKKLRYAPVLDVVQHWVGMVKTNTPSQSLL